MIIELPCNWCKEKNPDRVSNRIKLKTMKQKSLKLKNLKVESFITNEDHSEQSETIKGGARPPSWFFTIPYVGCPIMTLNTCMIELCQNDTIA